VLSDDRQQCISRRHRPYFKDLAAAMATNAAADDDSSSNGVENPAYNGEGSNDTLNSSSGSVPSPVANELGHQSEMVRDPSVFREDSAYDRWRRTGKPQERPVLSRFVSDMSDISNTTTSTFVPSTPSLRSNGEQREQRL